MEHAPFPEPEKEKKEIYLDPIEVVEEALSKIQPDGSVKYFDEYKKIMWKIPISYGLVRLFRGDQFYEDELVNLAQIIASSSIKFIDEKGEWRVGHLATHLRPYCKIPDFIKEATSIIAIDKETKEPLFPTKVPEGWKPPSQRHESMHDG